VDSNCESLYVIVMQMRAVLPEVICLDTPTEVGDGPIEIAALEEGYAMGLAMQGLGIFASMCPGSVWTCPAGRSQGE
jgi:hypothetical protein